MHLTRKIAKGLAALSLCAGVAVLAQDIKIAHVYD